MKRIILLFLIILTGVLCNKNRGNADFEAVFRQLCSSAAGKQAAVLYSSGTLNSLRKAGKAGINSGTAPSLFQYFTPSTKLKILNRKISGDRAIIRVRYMEHPVENVIGSEIDYTFVNENGKWKIDFKSDIDKIIDRQGSEAGQEYLRNKASRY